MNKKIEPQNIRTIAPTFHEEYLTELKRHKWRIMKKGNNWNCIHPVEENLTCGEYEDGVAKLIPQGEINYPKGFSRDRIFWICPQHLSFYRIDEN